jgi:hypothetical protein
MRMSFNPQRRDDALAISKAGDVLTINDEPFDFSALPDGASLPTEAIDCPWIAGDVKRLGGELVMTLILPIGAEPSEAQAFPADIVDPPDGPIALPQPDPEEA